MEMDNPLIYLVRSSAFYPAGRQGDGIRARRGGNRGMVKVVGSGYKASGLCHKASVPRCEVLVIVVSALCSGKRLPRYLMLTGGRIFVLTFLGEYRT
jgi:hypothetical protein